VEKKLKEIMSIVFNEPIENINDKSSFESIDKWDSLAHLNLIIAIEESFNVKLSDNEVEDSLSFNSLKKILKNKNIS